MQILGAYEEALKIHSLALKATEELLSKDPDNELYQSSLQMNLDEIFTLGNRFYNMGRFLQAKNCYEIHLLISQKLLENDPENVAYQSNVGVTLNNLGALLSDMGRIEEAKERYEKALEIYEKLLENRPRKRSVPIICRNDTQQFRKLAFEYGAHRRGKTKVRKSTRNETKNSSKTDPENVAYQSYVGMTLNNLGNLLSDMGRIEEAKQRYEKALEMYEKLLKTDPENVAYQSDVGMTLNNLGNLLSDMGRIEEAKQRYEESLTIYTEPMQYLTIGKKSHSIMKLIDLNSKLATEEKEPLDQMRYLREVYKLCKRHQEFFIKYELKNERELVTEAGLNAYIDFLMKRMKLENGFEKRAKKYGMALEAVKKLEDN